MKMRRKWGAGRHQHLQWRSCNGGVGASRKAGASAQRGAGARCMGGWFQLERGHRAPSGRRHACNRGSKSADVARRFCRRDTPRFGAAGWPDRAGRPFLGRHRHQRSGGGSEGRGACLCCSAGTGRGRRFRRPVGKFPTSRCGPASRNAMATPIFPRKLFSKFANGVAHEKAEVLHAEQEPTAASLFGGRTTVAAGRSAELVCGVEARSDDIARSGTIPGSTNESDDRRAGGRSPFPGLPSARDRRLDPGCSGPQPAVAAATRSECDWQALKGLP